MRRVLKKITSIMLSLVMVISLIATIPATKAEAATTPTVSYKVHRQTYGWESSWKTNGATSGTVGEGKRLESIKIDVSGSNLGVAYRTHIQSYGWESTWRTDGQLSGTEGQAKRLEAIQIRLTGSDADNWDIYYRVHAQTYGWLGWAKNGESAGTAGQGKRLEAIQIVVVEKGEFAYNTPHEGSLGCAFVDIAKNPSEPADGAVSYMTHVQSYGNQAWVSDGSIAGTSGEGKRLEQISIKIDSSKLTDHYNYEPGDEPVQLGIEYSTHVQSYGWLDWVSDGTPSGTSGEGKRLEAIKIRLTGRDAELYSVYYRVHAQSYGWLGWVGDGCIAGTIGCGKRLEAIQIAIIPKMTQSPNYLPGKEGGEGYVLNRPITANKLDLLPYLGTDIFEFEAKYGNFWDCNYSDSYGITDEWANITATNYYMGYGKYDPTITYISISEESNYSLAGVCVGVSRNIAEEQLMNAGWLYTDYETGHWSNGVYVDGYRASKGNMTLRYELEDGYVSEISVSAE